MFSAEGDCGEPRNRIIHYEPQPQRPRSETFGIQGIDIRNCGTPAVRGRVALWPLYVPD